VSDYGVNNTYQYILDREDTHLGWLTAALASLGAAPDANTTALPLPDGGKLGPDAAAVLEDDASRARALVEAWTPMVAVVSHARHRRMLELMLGEVREHQRFFELGLAGHADLLGRRPEGGGTGGGVMSTRWIE
jgi:hypothetical protein